MTLACSGTVAWASGPTIDYATYYGGVGEEKGVAIAVDSAGNTYVAGTTESSNFLGRGETDVDEDVFVVKINAAGSSVLYTASFGSDGPDQVTGLAVDSSGAAYVVGVTNWGGFATEGALQENPAGDSDGFVVKLDAQGTIAYATFLGGGDEDGALGVAVDSSGAAYVTGWTYSEDFPTVNPLQGELGGQPTDAFLAKLNASGTALAYSTYLGGGKADHGRAVAVDSSGVAYVVGVTTSTDFPAVGPQEHTLNGVSDAFIIKVESGGASLVYSKLLGGGGGEEGTSVAVDSSGNAYIAGATGSHDFPVVNAAQAEHGGLEDVFVAKLSPTASVLAATFLGGAGHEKEPRLAVDGGGKIHVSASTGSTDVTTIDPLQSQRGARVEMYLARLSSSGSTLEFATYLGGGDRDEVLGIAAESGGDLHVVGRSKSSDFSTVGAIQSTLGGRGDAVVLEIKP